MISAKTRTTLGLADQIISSATNFGLTIVAAHSLDARGFGVFAIFLATYVLTNGVIRGMASEPLIVQFSGSEAAAWRPAAARACRRATFLAICAAGGILSLTPLVPSAYQAALIALAVLLPGLVVQDTGRFALMALGRPDIALISDTIWAVLQVAAIIFLVASDQLRLPSLLLSWGLAGVAAGIFIVWRMELLQEALTRPRSALNNTGMGIRFAADFLISQGGTQFTIFFLGLTAGAIEAGRFRLAQAAFGPLVIVMSGTRLAVLPELVRTRRRSLSILGRRVAELCAVLTTVALVWGGAVYLMPLALGRLCFGDLWSEARGLTPAVTVAVAAGMAETAALAGIRAVADASGGLRARILVGSSTVVAATGGALLAGARGAAIGAAIVGPPGFIVWWSQFRSSLKQTKLDETLP